MTDNIIPMSEYRNSVTLSYGQIRDPQFMVSFNKLVGASTKCAKVAYSLGRMAKSISDETRTLQASWAELLIQYSEKDEDGNPIPPNDKGQVSIPDDKLQEFSKLAMEFNARTFQSAGRAIKSSELEGVEGLSAIDMLNLDGVVVE